MIPGVRTLKRDFYEIEGPNDFPNRRSTRGTINQAFIFDELEVVGDNVDEVFDEHGSKVSSSPNDFEVTSFRQCVKHIYRTQGFLSFWNGNLANCLRYILVAKSHINDVIATFYGKLLPISKVDGAKER